MKTYRFALGSNDGENLFDGHMGEADFFYIYEIKDNGSWKEIDKRLNTTPEEKKHADENKLKKATEIFEDCDFVVARHKSPNFIKMSQNTKFQPVVVRREKIEDAIKELTTIFNTISEKVERRRQGERFKEIIEIK